MGFEGHVVTDPVFLLTSQEWNRFDTHEGENEDYILTYDFEKRNSPIGRLANRLARLHQCTVFSIGPYHMKYASRSYVDYGPDKFLSLIKNARCVISNSFHGSAFSMIYGKDFFVLNRKDGLNLRMRDLLAQYHLSHRLIGEDISDQSLMSPIDYSSVRNRIDSDIIHSKQFLQEQISIPHV